VLFTNDDLHSHLSRKHKMTLSVYKQAHLSSTESDMKPVEKVKKRSHKKKSENLAKKIILTPEVISIKKEELDSCEDGIIEEKHKKNSVCRGKLDPLNSDPLPGGQANENAAIPDEAMFSDRAEDMRQIVCNMCHRPNSCLRNHVRTKHNMVIQDFRKLYPEKIFSCETFHRYVTLTVTSSVETNADLDPSFYLNADPDAVSQTNADPDPDPGQTFVITKSWILTSKIYTLCRYRY
jgi:hypothetical protein